MAKSNSYSNLRNRRRLEVKLRTTTVERLVSKLMALVCEKGVEFTDSLLDQSNGTDFAVNEQFRWESHLVICAIVADTLGIEPNSCITLGKTKRKVLYSKGEEKYLMLSLIVKNIAKFTKTGHLNPMVELFGLSKKQISAYNQGQYFKEKSNKVIITPEQAKVLSPSIKLRALHKHAYQQGKEIFIEELVELLIYSFVNKNRFSPADQSMLSGYSDKIEKNIAIIKENITPKQ